MIDASLSFEDSGFYAKIVLDYLHGEDALKSFYRYPYQMDSFDDAIKQRKFPVEQRALLCDTIEKQYQRLQLDITQHEVLQQNIAALQNENTFTITTGHQICLATGPLYFIIKITHAIKLAQELSQRFPDKKVVPVFWMATEDHDFEEIRSVQIGEQKISWDMDSAEAPVGRMATHHINRFLDGIHLDDSYTDILLKWKSYYEQASNLADATHQLVHDLFAAYGLVILNADDAKLKQSFTKIIREDVLHQKVFEALQTTNNQLNRQYKLQVSGRSINHFYIHDGARKLIDFEHNLLKIKDTNQQFTVEEMEQEIVLHPEKFSPNVVLRPVYQEYILPNLAYIGGPGELAYWLQLKGVFDLTDTNYPVLVCRNSFVLLQTTSARKLRKLNLQPKDLFTRKDVLIKQLVHALEPTSHKELMNQVTGLYQQLIDEVAFIDNQVSSGIIEEKKKTEKALHAIAAKITKAKKQKHDLSIAQLHEILADVLPNGAPAERVFNILHYTHQPDEFIRLIFQHSQALPQSIAVITL